MIDGILQDLRYGLRSLRKNSTLTVAAVSVLALGIGATTAIFSVVDAVIMRPLPLPDAERVVQVWEHHAGRGMSISHGNYEDYASRNEVFERISPIGRAWGLALQDAKRELGVMKVSSDFLPIMGVAPILGRGFLPHERYDPDQPSPAILSYRFWQRHFGGDRAAIAQTLTLKRGSQADVRLTVVGVAPERLVSPPIRTGDVIGRELEFDVLVPRDVGPGHRQSILGYYVFARLKPGVTVEQARANLDGIAAGIAAEHLEADAEYGVDLISVPQLVRRHYGGALYLLWAAAGFVLLIACVNVANLLLARGVMRERELALRSVLGAARGRLVRQLLTESMFLGLLGGLTGLVLAVWGTRVLMTFVPSDIYRLDQVGVDLKILAFLTAVSLLTALLFGLVPALRGARQDLTEPLKEGARGSIGSRLRFLRLLVVTEVALALVLMTGAALMLRTYQSLTNVDLGFAPQNVLTVQIQTRPRALTRYRTAAQRSVLHDQIKERVESLPGVMSVASGDPPLAPDEIGTWEFTLADRPAPRPDDLVRADYNGVSPDYFETLSIPVLAGRTFTDADVEQQVWARGASREEGLGRRRGVTLPVIINETMARRYWPGQSAIGKRLYWGAQDPQRVDDEPGGWDERYPIPFLLTVVGIVPELKTWGLDQEPQAQIYFPSKGLGMQFQIRTAASPLAAAASIGREIEAVDPAELSVVAMETVDARIGQASAHERFRMLLIGLFAALAVVLAAVGLFGVMAYAVSQRTREFGIRISLGAQRADIIRLVSGQGLRLILFGVAVGLVGAFGLTRFLSSMLFGVKPTDPVSFVASALLLGTVGVIACYLPTRRATRVDPVQVLKAE